MPQPQHNLKSVTSMESQLNLNTESMKSFFIEVCGGDADMIDELLQMYLRSLDELARQISSSVTSGDLVTLRRAAHTLKSSTRVFGAEALAHNCELLEEAALSGNLSRVPALVLKVESQRRAMHQQLPAAVEVAISTF